jgi:hypothetical protein
MLAAAIASSCVLLLIALVVGRVCELVDAPEQLRSSSTPNTARPAPGAWERSRGDAADAARPGPLADAGTDGR